MSLNRKIFVAIPNQGVNVVGITAFLVRNQKYIFELDMPFKRPIYFNRNQYMQEFIKSGADWLLMIDSDTVPPINAMEIIDKIIKENKDIKVLSGWYNTYNQILNKILPVFFKKDVKGFFRTYTDKELKNMFKSNIFRVDGVGGGFLLVHRDAIKNMEKPYFDNVYNKDKTSLIESEDLYFSDKIKEQGFKIYVTPKIRCTHIKNLPI
jgi:GT2 family glycosyltransferase